MSSIPQENYHNGDFEVIGMRRFHALQPGDKFKAVIQDIKPGQVTINLGNGALYTARSMVLPEARIGEASAFSVKENDFEGRIVLEMVKLAPKTKMTNMIKEALLSAKLAVTPENIEIGMTLLDNGLPVDSQTLHKAMYFFNSKEQTLTPEEVIKLLKSDTTATVPTPQRFTFDMRV